MILNRIKTPFILRLGISQISVRGPPFWCIWAKSWTKKSFIVGKSKSSRPKVFFQLREDIFKTRKIFRSSCELFTFSKSRELEKSVLNWLNLLFTKFSMWPKPTQQRPVYQMPRLVGSLYYLRWARPQKIAGSHKNKWCLCCPKILSQT